MRSCKIGKLFPLLLAFWGAGGACAVLAQSSDDDINKRVYVIEEGQKLIIKELQEIKRLLLQKPQMPAMTGPELGSELELGNKPALGSENARLIMIEFTDYECPFCGRYSREILPEILKQYVDSGKIRYTIQDNPLPMHKMAGKAAEASLCARDQGKYWEMHDLLMSKQESLNDLPSLAAAIKLDAAKYQDCLKANKYTIEINKGVASAAKHGIASVPSFVLAQTDFTNPSKAKVVGFVRGAQPFNVFKTEIEKALNNLTP